MLGHSQDFFAGVRFVWHRANYFLYSKLVFVLRAGGLLAFRVVRGHVIDRDPYFLLFLWILYSLFPKQIHKKGKRLMIHCIVDSLLP